MNQNTHKKTPAGCLLRVPRLIQWTSCAFLLGLIFLPAFSFAQTTGSVAGRIFKPATSEYVRGAEIRVQGTNLVVFSEREGRYFIGALPVGEAVLEVSFVGSETAVVPVAISAGATTTRNVDLNVLGSRSGIPSGQEVVQMSEFVITTEVEGNAKAIQEQKNAMTIGSHISSDAFQDAPDGNVGEYMKWLAGVDLEYVEFDARGPRLRGMDPQYASVTIDGISLASADAFGATVGTANAGNEGSRAFGFEAISLSSVEAIEVYKSLSADQSANAPAGTINLRSKRAFDRKGRRLMLQLTGNFNSEDFTIGKRVGPGDSGRSHPRFSGSLEYSDVFLDNRLGVVFTFNQSSVYNRQDQFFMSTINRTTSGTDAREAVPIVITYTDLPKITDRRTSALTVDFKATPDLSVGLTATRSSYLATMDNRQFRFTTAANNNAAQRAAVIGDDPMVSFTTGDAATSTVTTVGGASKKITENTALSTRVDWRPLPNLDIEVRLGWSESDNDYEALARGIAGATGSNALPAKFTATRSDVMSSDWTFTQIGGGDWGDLANYSRPTITDDDRRDLAENYTYQIDARYTLPVSFPAFVKAGLKRTEDYRKFYDRRNWAAWEYIGPGGVTPSPNLGVAGTGGSWAGYETNNPVDLSSIGSHFYSLSGRTVAYAGRSLVGQLWQEHPEWFSQNAAMTVNNFYNSFIANDRMLREDIDAGYLMGYARLKKLEIQGGLRYENTLDTTREFVQRPRDEVIAAGYTVDGTGRANTIPGLQYQFHTLPKRERQGEYDDWFPSAAIKYHLTANLQAQFTFNKAIARPPLVQLSGATTVNETSRVISAANPGLLPERSDNYSARLAYYLKRGFVAVGVFENEISNLRQTFDFVGEEALIQFGFDPVEYADYTVRSTSNSDESRTFRGMEIEYRQGLYFLPRPFDGLNVFANYTRLYADMRRGGLSPHQVTAGVSYAYKNLNFSVSSLWTPDVPWSQNIVTRYKRERLTADLSAGYRINSRLTFSASVRNVTNEPHEIIEKRPGQRVELQQRDNYGALWTFSLRGTF